MTDLSQQRPPNGAAEAIIAFINAEIVGSSNGRVGIDDELLLDGHIDSLGIVRLVAFLEEKFGKQIPPEQVTIENFRNVATIARYVETLPG